MASGAADAKLRHRFNVSAAAGQRRREEKSKLNLPGGRRRRGVSRLGYHSRTACCDASFEN